MSKSDPNSAIFMEDSAAEVKTKIKKAFCPPEQASSTSPLVVWQDVAAYQQISWADKCHRRL